jgi:hypothetical protein
MGACYIGFIPAVLAGLFIGMRRLLGGRAENSANSTNVRFPFGDGVWF